MKLNAIFLNNRLAAYAIHLRSHSLYSLARRAILMLDSVMDDVCGFGGRLGSLWESFLKSTKVDEYKILSDTFDDYSRLFTIFLIYLCY